MPAPLPALSEPESEGQPLLPCKGPSDPGLRWTDAGGGAGCWVSAPIVDLGVGLGGLDSGGCKLASKACKQVALSSEQLTGPCPSFDALGWMCLTGEVRRLYVAGPESRRANPPSEIRISCE